VYHDGHDDIDHINLPALSSPDSLWIVVWFSGQPRFPLLSSTKTKTGTIILVWRPFLYPDFVVVPFLAGNFIALADKGFLLGGIRILPITR